MKNAPRVQDSFLIREIPTEDRPRERLLKLGPSVLSNAELLAVLLRTGCQGRSALHLAREILRHHGDLAGLLSQPTSALKQRGLGPAKVATILAALEVGRRLARAELPSRDLLCHPDRVAVFLNLRYSLSDQEVMGALFLDTRNRLIEEKEFFRGALNRAVVEPRALLKHALLKSAAGLILFHTHPSGDPTPSPEDRHFTRRMVEAGDLVGVQVVDHLILGSTKRWESLRKTEPGLFKV